MTIRELLEKPTQTPETDHYDCLFLASDPSGKVVTLCRHSFPPLVPTSIWDKNVELHGMLEWQVVSENALYDFSQAPTKITRGDGKTAEIVFRKPENDTNFLGSFSLVVDGAFVAGANAWHKDGKTRHDTFMEALGSVAYHFLALH